MEDDSAATVAVGTLIGRAELWIEACSEEINHDAGQARIQKHRTPHSGTSRCEAHLEGRPKIGADESNFAPRESGAQREGVERIVLGLIGADGKERVGNEGETRHRGKRLAGEAEHAKRLEKSGTEFAVDERLKLVRVLADNRDAKVLQDRHQFREDRRFAQFVELEQTWNCGIARVHGRRIYIDAEIRPSLELRLEANDFVKGNIGGGA